jgi:ribosomal protein S18 acetylase RimI-like enzyme
MQITPLRPSDHARWSQLWSEYQLFYGVDIPAKVTENTWARLHNGRVRGLGARDSAGNLFGIVHFLFHEDTWSNAAACYMQDLYVAAAIRGSGCGRKLVQAVAEAAKAAGASSPYWLTHETNAVARRLYERLGKNHGFIQYTYAETPA